MKTRELIAKGFRPMIDKKGRTRLVLPVLELDPELSAELGEAQVDAAVQAAAAKFVKQVAAKPCPKTSEEPA